MEQPLTIPRSSGLQSLSRAMLDRQQASLALLGQRHYSVTECSEALRINRSTFRKWLHAGLVRFSRTGPKGRIRVAESELARLLKGEGDPNL